VTLERARAFAAQPANQGQELDGRYAVWSSSGTSGEPAIYLHDRAALDVYTRLLEARMDRRLAVSRWWAQAASGSLGPWGLRPRSALISALDGPYASISFWRRQCRTHPWMGDSARAMSVTWPAERLIAELQAWQPAFVASYPSLLIELARWQREGRLAVAPLALWSGGERLALSTRQWIEASFGAPVVNDYGASECLSIAFECQHGRLHLNDDWVILEPIDRAGQPVPPGVPSHSVLLTHLANRIQPLIRYDLGDSVTFFAERCACGNPRPSFLVEGRTDDSLCLDDGQGQRVHLAPMALTTAVEDGADVHRFQLRQTTPDGIELRLDLSRSAEPERTRGAAVTALRRYLAAEGLPRARIDLSDEPPLLDARSGKLRQVVCLCPARG
jgi:phenylacetate-coenzyme A ligase PaaK-like adenylate-forming protein